MFATIRNAIKERGEYKFGGYGSFWNRFSIGPWRWLISLYKFEDDWSLHLFCLWITLWKTKTPPKEMMESWGFHFDFHERYLHLKWGHRYKFIYFPWMLDHCRVEVMLKDGKFVRYEKYKKCRDGRMCIEIVPEPASLFSVDLPYRYVLKSGEVQERTATVKVERRTWCWRGRPFRWFRWPSKTVTSINVSFSDEVGERTGSWKGGTVGCGYDLRPNETPEQCLRRMERERTF